MDFKKKRDRKSKNLEFEVFDEYSYDCSKEKVTKITLPDSTK